jgi:hypothetical protein
VCSGMYRTRSQPGRRIARLGTHLGQQKTGEEPLSEKTSWPIARERNTLTRNFEGANGRSRGFLAYTEKVLFPPLRVSMEVKVISWALVFHGLAPRLGAGYTTPVPASARSAVVVVEADNVVFPEVLTVLNLDEDQIFISVIANAVSAPLRYVHNRARAYALLGPV